MLCCMHCSRASHVQVREAPRDLDLCSVGRRQFWKAFEKLVPELRKEKIAKVLLPQTKNHERREKLQQWLGGGGGVITIEKKKG